MMSVSNSKRRGRLSSNSNKMGKSKFYPPEKNMLCDGIYGNSKLMYTVASLVGCVVQIQVQNGTIFEGVLRTFSQQLDIVLETAHKVNKSKSSLNTSTKGISPNVSNLIASYPFEGGIFDKLIFKLSDIILMVASTVDPDYAVKDNFTDTAISKFNGQVRERELEPWEDSISDGSDSELGGTNNIGFSIEDNTDGMNGWDANDMFRTNAEKYGVQSSYDNSLQDYTVPLLKKDTEEWKLQEEKALKIAQEIETNNAYQSRIQLENNDDNEEDRFSAVVRTTDQDNSTIPPSKYVLPQKRRSASSFKRQHNNPSSKVYNSAVLPPSIPNQSLSQVYEEASVASASCPNITVPKSEAAMNNPVTDAPVVKESDDLPECNPHPLKHIPPPMSMQYSTQTLPPRIERRNREKLNSKHKGRTDEIEEFKKFSSNFKLTEDKDLREINEPILESSGDSGFPESAISAQLERAKIVDSEDSQSAASTNSIVKFSTLNPNAKEFVFNPNAKAFTPRSMSVVTPPTQPPPPPEQNVLPPMMPPPQPIFTGVMATAPQYHVMQANIPVSVATITSPFATTTQPVPQPPPRFRKTSGQPLLAPPPPPQQLYSSTMAPGSILHAVSAPQTTTLSGYPQMNFVVGPRVVSPQPVGVIPTSHSMSYCDTSHLPTTHFIMSAHPSVSSATPHTLHQGGQQHSSQHRPPQCQTPVTLHPSPSPPVHQVPPPSHSQPPTPTSIMYPGGTHPLQQAAAANHQHSQLVHMHPHGVAFPTTNLQPQQLVLMQHQPGSLNPTSLHMLHSQAAHHPMHLPQMAIMPTSAAMTTANTPPYLQHP